MLKASEIPYPERFKVVSVIRIPTLVNIVAFIVSRFDHFFLKHFPTFIERPL